MRVSWCLGFLLLLLVSCAVCAPNEQQPLRVTAVLLEQSYCAGDEDLFSVVLKLRLRFENRTDQRLILDKAIGSLYYRVGVARSKEDLETGTFESHPIADWFFSAKDQLPTAGDLKSPDTSFVVLAPGDSFEAERTASAFAKYKGEKEIAGAIASGVHVLQVELSSWTRSGDPEVFKKNWGSFGRLVTEPLKTEPVEFRVAANPKIHKCKH